MQPAHIDSASCHMPCHALYIKHASGEQFMLGTHFTARFSLHIVQTLLTVQCKDIDDSIKGLPHVACRGFYGPVPSSWLKDENSSLIASLTALRKRRAHIVAAQIGRQGLIGEVSCQSRSCAIKRCTTDVCSTTSQTQPSIVRVIVGSYTYTVAAAGLSCA